MPLLAALLLLNAPAVQAPLDPYVEATSLLKEIRAAKSIEVRHVDGDTVLAKRVFKVTDSKETTIGASLLAVLQADFLKARNDSLPMCGFHADVAIVTKVKRTLKTELCFGCGVVQVEIPGPPMRRQLSWMMNDREAVKKAVHELYPGIKLGK